MPHPTDTAALFEAIRRWAAAHYPGHSRIRLLMDVPGDPWPLRLPVPPAAESGPPPAFVPNRLQAGILEALAGQALRTDALARAIDQDRRRLFKPDGLKELRAHGLVAHHPRLGYYRPDAPPQGLEGGE